MRSSHRSAVPVLLTAAALVLSGCGGGDDQPADTPATAGGGGPLQVVAATNVYGNIAAMVGGEDVEVTSIIMSPAQDPHSYEATVQDQLAVSQADVVIENGGGYDPFLDRLLEGSDAAVIDVVELSGLEPEHEDHDEGHDEDDHAHDHGGFNEHIWYNLPVMVTLADTLATEFGRLDDANATAYQERAEAFNEQLQPLQERLGDLTSDSEGRAVAITEPVPLYLLEAAGLENVTPEEYSEAIEEERDAPVTVLEEMRGVVEGEDVAFLAYNEQTEGPQTQAIRSDAEAAGLPVVLFTETIPDGDDYVSWMTSNIESIASTLGS